MKWLETIKVQTAGGQETLAHAELIALTREVSQATDLTGPLETCLYRHASVPGHFAIHLFWDTSNPQIRGSLLGLRLTQGMRHFGLVDHTVWLQNQTTNGNCHE